MAKLEKKSIADIIALKPQSRKPSAAEIDKITEEIHVAATPAPPPPVVTRTVVEPEPEPLPNPDEKIKRISVNTSVSLYLKAKTKATMQDQTLMAYIIGLMEADLK